MLEPRASRPFMPDYGTLPAEEGTGLLPWAWAVERLTSSHDYWLATIGDRGPQVTPLWALWLDDEVWFSCGGSSQKSRNLVGDPRATITTDNPFEPVIVEGRARLVADSAAVERFTATANQKYETSYEVSFFASNSLFALRPARAFGLLESDFVGSPTRWTFPAGAD